MDFRTRIKEICKEQGILQKDLADKLGITAIGLSQTLGQEYPQLQTLERIATALGVRVVDLFEKQGDFVAFVRRQGVTHTFNTEQELKAFVDTFTKE